MYITRADIYKIVLPLQQPFRTGFGDIIDREIVFVKLFDKSGLVGVGESACLTLPIYEPDFNDGIITLLKDFLIPQLFHKEIASIEDLEKIFVSIRGNNFAKTAIEAAFWHIVAQQQQKSLESLWGGTKKTIPAAISIGLGVSLEDSIRRVLEYIDIHKPQRAKIKIKPGIDIELIQAIRENYPHLPLQVDANASYTLEGVNVFQELDKYNLLMIEQPLQFNDILDHAILQGKINTPICLDESISSFHLAEQAIALKACQIINIKPQRVGGYWEAKKISELAASHNIPVWCGGMIESGWGQLFNCSLASLPNFSLDNDICLTKWYLADDILEEEIVEENGIIELSENAKKFVINESKFKKYTKQKISLT